jgi:Flp pilus assembly protein TadG
MSMCRELLARFALGFARERGGNVAMMWALMGAVLVGLMGITVDFTRAQMLRSQLQNAADGAALVAERSSSLSEEERTAAARAFFDAEMGALADSITSFSVVPLDGGGHQVVVSSPLQTSLARVVSDNDWNVTVSAEARSDTSPNYEIALILDTTGSMAGSRIADLRTAASGFVTLLLEGNDQTPYYTKIAVVPYSMAVNAGSYAESARGSITPGRSLSNPANNWLSATARNINTIQKMSCSSSSCPLRVETSGNHGYSAGDRVYITGVSGMTQVNNRVFIVDGSSAGGGGAPTSTRFYLNTFPGNTAVNGHTYGNYSSGSDTVRECLTTDCEVVFTANGHGFAANDYIYVTGVNGMSASNGGQAINNPSPLGTDNPTLWRVGTVVDANRFSLQGSFALNYSAYTSGGTAYCLTAGCEYYRFENEDDDDIRVHRISTCVTERNGANAYTDVSPATALLGRNYPSTGNPCPAGNAIQPLSTNMSSLNSSINALTASGSTGGHLGIAWGWYTLSPNFSSLFTGASAPGSYNDNEVVKIAVLMTDGEYNSSYCNGVISGPTSTSGSGSENDQINCAAPNGHAFDQAMALCEEMQDAGVIVYTVGFDIVDDQRARDLVDECATDDDHVVMASNGEELIAAFATIGTEINHLRLTR